MTSRAQWLKTGEPVGDKRVEVELRTTYHTGPNEQRSDDVTRGVAPMQIFDIIQSNDEIQKHTHEDDSILLSALSDEVRTELLADFQPDDDLTQLIREGCSPSVAVDYLMVEQRGWTQSAWSDVRDISQSSVSENVAKAREKLDDD